MDDAMIMMEKLYNGGLLASRILDASLKNRIQNEEIRPRTKIKDAIERITTLK